MLASRTWSAIGTTVSVLAALPGDEPAEGLADQAAAVVAEQLDDLDLICSRFRVDSETRRLRTGTEVSVSASLNNVLAAGLRTARRTRGLVDPTVGRSLSAIGYDDDLERVRRRSRADRHAAAPRPVPGYWRIHHDEARRRVLVPHGVELDFGSSAKAYAADRAAATVADRLPGSFLVNLGGDLAVGGPERPAGWQIALDTGLGDARDHPVITLRSGGLATSSTVRRTWSAGDRSLHHIVDPRTGDVAQPVWRAVTVTAATCEQANAASTAAVILGTDAAPWLAHHGLHARLVSRDGAVVYVGDWPPDTPGRVQSRDGRSRS